MFVGISNFRKLVWPPKCLSTFLFQNLYSSVILSKIWLLAIYFKKRSSNCHFNRALIILCLSYGVFQNELENDKIYQGSYENTWFWSQIVYRIKIWYQCSQVLHLSCLRRTINLWEKFVDVYFFIKKSNWIFIRTIDWDD